MAKLVGLGRKTQAPAALIGNDSGDEDDDYEPPAWNRPAAADPFTSLRTTPPPTGSGGPGSTSPAPMQFQPSAAPSQSDAWAVFDEAPPKAPKQKESSGVIGKALGKFGKSRDPGRMRLVDETSGHDGDDDSFSGFNPASEAQYGSAPSSMKNIDSGGNAQSLGWATQVTSAPRSSWNQAANSSSPWQHSANTTNSTVNATADAAPSPWQQSANATSSPWQQSASTTGNQSNAQAAAWAQVTGAGAIGGYTDASPGTWSQPKPASSWRPGANTASTASTGPLGVAKRSSEPTFEIDQPDPFSSPPLGQSERVQRQSTEPYPQERSTADDDLWAALGETGKKGKKVEKKSTKSLGSGFKPTSLLKKMSTKGKATKGEEEVDSDADDSDGAPAVAPARPLLPPTREVTRPILTDELISLEDPAPANMPQPPARPTPPVVDRRPTQGVGTVALKSSRNDPNRDGDDHPAVVVVGGDRPARPVLPKSISAGSGLGTWGNTDDPSAQFGALGLGERLPTPPGSLATISVDSMFKPIRPPPPRVDDGADGLEITGEEYTMDEIVSERLHRMSSGTEKGYAVISDLSSGPDSDEDTRRAKPARPPLPAMSSTGSAGSIEASSKPSRPPAPAQPQPPAPARPPLPSVTSDNDRSSRAPERPQPPAVPDKPARLVRVGTDGTRTNVDPASVPRPVVARPPPPARPDLL